MALERQPDSIPTNKSLTVGLFTVVLIHLEGVVAELWPSIAPSAFAGDSMTALLSAILGCLVAWFVPDRAGKPV
jgi:hypothetical protein